MKARGLLGCWWLAGLFLLMSCQETAVIQQQVGSKDMYPDHESWESTVIISRSGSLATVANSQRMIQYNDKEIAHLIGEVRVDFYDDDGLHASRLFADSVEVNTRTNTMSAFGQVVIHSDSGLVLRTEIMRWDDQYDMMVTEDTVLFTTDNGDTLHGVGFESDMDLTNWKIYQPWGVTERGFGISD